ncbi:ATP-binding protein [Shewanella frigidimarina]|uniref:ATP-binding protein n=1 Tax=Shewanella frigidimarina TaxID=56812 RepID=UPI003D7A6622
MPLSVTGQQNYNGFILSEPFVHNGNLVVLTGRNGCGKTRFLESISKQQSIVNLAGEQLTQQDIMLVAQAQLTPNFGGAYNDTQFQSKITSTLQLFDLSKNEFDSPFDPSKSSNRGRGQEGGLPYESLYHLCNSIALHLDKAPSKLTHDEIKIHFEDYVPSILGFQNISGICNQYIQRNKLNRYNRYRSEQEGEDVAFLTEDQFINRFGHEPWILLNNIIDSTFDGKFYFSEPNIKSYSYSYNANLIQKGTNLPVSVNALSSGEKTLLWLALTLFNSQYYDNITVRTPKLLLLDEPDAFLHPKMVVKMYRVLREFCSSFESRIIITTHSPTTVALAPDNSTYVVRDNAIVEVTKDEGITELLDGITQISINPENRRQVFVESHYDADFYQSISNAVLRHSKEIDPHISLAFVSSGAKFPQKQIAECLSSVLKINDSAQVEAFIKAINGVGSCSHVYGSVEALIEEGNSTVRGIVDWDGKNKPTKGVSVLAERYAYTVENLALDPICISILLNYNNPDIYSSKEICGSDTHWQDWMKCPELLQKVTDWYIGKILDRPNQKNMPIEYLCGVVVQTDSEYLKRSGHDYEGIVLDKFPQLRRLLKKQQKGELKVAIAQKGMVGFTGGKLIPKLFEELFVSLN